MRVLVAGGAGYIGSAAARQLLERGDTPVVYDDFSTGFRTFTSAFEVIEGDIGDAQTLASALKGVDAVMHFAARAYVGVSVRDPRQYYDTNVQRAITFLNTVVDSGIDKLIFSSTCAVYGSPEKLPITEDTPKHPLNPYGDTKLAFEHALSAYSNAYNLRFLALRYFNASGAEANGTIGELHDPETHLLPLIMRAARTGEPISVFGDDYPTPDGTCIRDYIHVSDLASAHIAALDHLVAGGASNFINLGTGHGASIREILDRTQALIGRPVPHVIHPRRAGDPPVLVSDAARAREVLNWTPRFSLDDILKSAWLWENNLATQHAE
jgi:UDP-glucose-4-epimerase GalE